MLQLSGTALAISVCAIGKLGVVAIRLVANGLILLWKRND